MPDIRTMPADPDADRLGLERLADWCGRYSPATGVDGEDGIWIDASGSAHLFGGEAAMLKDLGRRLARLGLHHRLGLAETMGAAWAIARYGDDQIVEGGDLVGSLADLPVAGLRLQPETVTLLKRLGLKRIGQLDALPRVAVGRRFSSKAAGEAVLERLDQAFGREDEPLCPRHPLPAHRTAQGFLEPIVERPALAHGLTQLTADLCRMLDKAGEGALRLALLACRVDGDVRILKVGAGRPTRDPRHIERLFAERLETIDAGFGIEHLVLQAEQVGSLGPKQTTLGGGIAENADLDEHLAQLIDRLANRLGPDAVTVSVPFESHIPERAEGRAAPGSTSGSWADMPRLNERPSCLLLRPEPIKALAEVPDGPPLRFTWRRVTRRIVKSEGPERIAPSWVGTTDGVNLAAETRDYYRVEDEDGQRYWLFRKGLYDTAGYDGGAAEHQVNAVGRADWFVHGLFG